MKPIEVRLHDDDSTDGIEAKEIQVKGLLPIKNSYRLGFMTSVFDDTTDKFEPVISSVDQFQEPHTTAYQHAVEVGPTDPGIGFISWVRVGVILPQILEPPYGGKRKFAAVLRLVNLDNRPSITNGFHAKDEPGILWQTVLNFEYNVKSKGYVELADSRDAARAICVKIAVAVAMWDGTLVESEGRILKTWIEKVLSSASGERREKLKASLNGALRDSYAAAKKFELSLRDLTKALNDTGDDVTKYEAVELCYDLLAAKGTKSVDEAHIIDLVAKSLDLDLSELEKIRDIKIVGLAAGLSKNASVEQLLGIDPKWEPEAIKRHLRNEFQKWNNRLTALPEGPERESAQTMLDVISEARKRYG